MDRQTDRPNLYAPDLLMQGHKNSGFQNIEHTTLNCVIEPISNQSHILTNSE